MVPDPVTDALERIADHQNVEGTALPPVYDAIDPAALIALVTHDATHDPDLRIAFNYLDYRVIIHGPGELTVRHRDQ